MQLKLKLVGGRCETGGRSLQAKFFLVGRHPECQIRPVDEGVSERHCMLLIGGNSVRVRDLQSSTGTFVNGEPITHDRYLSQGDEIRVGQTTFSVQLKGSVAPVVDNSSRIPPAAVPAPIPPRFETLTGDQVEAWLEEADKEAEASHRGDLSRLQMKLPEVAATERPEEPVPQKSAPPKKSPGKLPPKPKLVAPSSDAAAAQVLEKFHQRPARTGRA